MKGIIIGIENGGTYVRTGVYDVNQCKMIEYQKKKFVKEKDAVTEIECNIITSIGELIHRYSEDKLLGIGISLAAIMDKNKERIQIWPNHQKWNGFPITKFLREKFSMPIIIEDDANCGLLGEYTWMQSKEIKNLVYLSIGTGVGCGLMFNGKLFTGDNGLAGELGHMSFASAKTVCTCGKTGCFQSVVSGPAITKRYNSITNKNYTDLKCISELYKKNNPQAIFCYDEIIHALSCMICNLSMLLDIKHYIIGGGVVNFHNYFIRDIQREVNEVIHNFGKTVKIHKSVLGEEAGLFGAIELIKNYYKER